MIKYSEINGKSQYLEAGASTNARRILFRSLFFRIYDYYIQNGTSSAPTPE